MYNSHMAVIQNSSSQKRLVLAQKKYFSEAIATSTKKTLAPPYLLDRVGIYMWKKDRA